MKKIEQYRRLAEEAQTNAAHTSDDKLRRALLDIAEAWTQLAEERELLVKRSNNGD
jgi:hypothetical protein